MQLNSLRAQRWVRWLATALAALLALWGLAWVAVPPLLKSQLEKIASEQLGRQLSVGEIDFKPWTLELTLNDLRLAQAGGDAPQLQIRRIYIDAEMESLLRFAPVVDTVELDDPHLWVTHLGGGRYDIDDVLARLSKPASGPGGDPQRFAVYNIMVNGGAADYADRAVSRMHTLRELKISIPFLSNLASQRQVKVEPRLAFVLNGSRFDTAAVGTPFAQTRRTDATLRIAGFDLAPYLAYWPAALPVKLQAGVLEADLKLAFEQTPAATLRLSGRFQANAVRVVTADAAPLLAFDALTVAVDELRPLDRVARLGLVELAGPQLAVRRDKAGRWNLDMATAPGGPALAAAAAAAAVAAASTPSAGATPTAAPPGGSSWSLDVAKVLVRDGATGFDDNSLPGNPRVELAGLGLEASGIRIPFEQAVQFNGSATVRGWPRQSTLTFSGTATTQAASATLAVSGLPLSLGAPYLASYLTPTLAGRLDADLGIAWQAARDGSRPKPAGEPLLLTIRRLTLDGLALTQGREPLASMRHLALGDTQIDFASQTVQVGKLALEQPQMTVSRDAQGRWMAERWLKTQPQRPEAAPATPNNWRVTLGDVGLNNGQVSWRDAVPAQPVALDLTALQFHGKNMVVLAPRNGTPSKVQSSPVSVSARVAARQAEPGRLSYQGTVVPAPLRAEGRLDMAGFPLHALAPYFETGWNLALRRADARFKGTVRYDDTPRGPVVRMAGDAALEDLLAYSTSAGGTASLVEGEELLSWKALNLGGLAVAVAPGAATTVDVKQTSLSDFYARILIDTNGRINLQNLTRADTAAPNATATGTATAVATQPEAVIRIGPIGLVNGRVRFTDQFIKPNYSANLSDLNGSLSAFSSVVASGSPTMADLRLKGRAEGTADLEITGKLNPLAKPLALDIRGQVRDLELPALSPYSVRYAGHGIQRGKLSMDVNYKVLPNGQLTASNRLVLNQLQFGDAVEGASASLPVKLAVALLADSNGVIDIDLPVSGSLNDPQFRLAPVIFKAVLNLILKAVTAPFTLLASALGGGGQELSTVNFAPGSFALEPQARTGLDRVARALKERPALKLTVTGAANFEAEQEALRQARLAGLLEEEKRRQAGLSATAIVTVTPAQAPELLKEVYHRADIAKPKNLLGLAKDIPQAEMRALLLASLRVTADDANNLAVQRAVAVRDYLLARELPSQRLFLGAVKTPATGVPWRPRAELSLATR